MESTQLFDSQAFGIDFVNCTATVANALIGQQVDVWFRAEFVDGIDNSTAFFVGIRPRVTVEILLFHR